MGGVFLLSLAVLHSNSISEGELIHLSGATDFVAAGLGIPLGLLALVAKEPCIPRSHRTITTGERVLDRLAPHSTE